MFTNWKEKFEKVEEQKKELDYLYRETLKRLNEAQAEIKKLKNEREA